MPAHLEDAPPTFDDVLGAARQIAGAAHRTPVVTSRTIDDRVGARLFFKCENLQRAGAFKFRGAYNALSRLSADQRRRGVVTFSSGNHAQAIALAGQLLDVPRVIVMPADAPAVKIAATRGYGGEVVLYDRAREDREEIGRRLGQERGLAVIPPYNHPHIIAGQGTAALELFEETGALDHLFAPCGGGGLLAGSSLSAAAASPGCRVVGVEPAAGDDAARSFRTRTLQTVSNPQTVADGARTPSLGSLTFPIVLQHASDIVSVEDPPLLRTMFHLWERLKLVVEPTGALGAAAAVERVVDVRGARVGIILSGGNVELAQIPAWLEISARARHTGQPV
ncbi:MAG: threo-3-hydroxy-L-aspartate ammonia-lyase [Acidobacteria bacterium]|nr:threo-3-hydroxy-L-aspartate ammonia-lyase [Acidobacteriota bacterium]